MNARGRGRSKPAGSEPRDATLPDDPLGPPIFSDGFPEPDRLRVTKLLKVDDLLFGREGVVERVAKHPKGMAMLEEVVEQAYRCGGIRQPLLDLGAAHFGMEPLDLGRAVPGLVNAPMWRDLNLVASFYELLIEQLNDGWVLVLGETEPMALVDALYVPGGPLEKEFKVIVGVVPGRYVGVAKKRSELQRLCSMTEPKEFERTVALALSMDAKGRPAVSNEMEPEDEEEASRLALRLVMEVHESLFPGRERLRAEGLLRPAARSP